MNNRALKTGAHAQTGFALIIVLWLIALLTILCASFSQQTRVELKLTTHLVSSAKAERLAEAGVWRAIHELLIPPALRNWEVENAEYLIKLDEHEISIHIQDEAGKIDLNAVSSELLVKFIEHFTDENTSAIELADAILDWRDRDNLVRSNGAEDDDYKAAASPYGAKDGLFNSVEELLQVYGVTQTSFDRLKSHLTIHSRQPGVRVEAASRELLMLVLDASEETLDEILTARAAAEPAWPKSLRNILGGLFRKSNKKSNIYAITSTAKVNNHSTQLEVIVSMIRQQSQPFHILSWKERTPNITPPPVDS